MDELMKLPFVKAFMKMIANCTDFNGRTGREDFWWAYLCVFIINFIVSIVCGVLVGITGFGLFSILARLVSLALSLLSLAMSVRRLHDTNKSGWWLLLSLTIIGCIPLLIFMIQEGDAGDNQYGPNPKYLG